jgi:hypothetical protein
MVRRDVLLRVVAYHGAWLALLGHLNKTGPLGSPRERRRDKTTNSKKTLKELQGGLNSSRTNFTN